MKKQTHVPKGHPRFTKPVEIQKQVGPCTYRLSDGKRWHSSHLTRVPDAAVMPADQRTQATEAAVMPTEQPLAGTSQPCTPDRTMHDRVHPAQPGLKGIREMTTVRCLTRNPWPHHGNTPISVCEPRNNSVIYLHWSKSVATSRTIYLPVFCVC